jgi:hypothetical protein
MSAEAVEAAQASARTAHSKSVISPTAGYKKAGVLGSRVGSRWCAGVLDDAQSEMCLAGRPRTAGALLCVVLNILPDMYPLPRSSDACIIERRTGSSSEIARPGTSSWTEAGRVR